MTTTNRILGTLAIVGLSVMMLVSCGNGSSSVVSGKKIATNEFLGDLPNLVYQKHFTDSIRISKRSAERKKFEGGSKSDREKWEKVKAKYDALEKEDNAKFEAELEKIKPTLMGRDIPFEVEEGTGYDILSCKIVGVSGNGVTVEFEVKITDVKVCGPPLNNMFTTTISIWTSMQQLDKNGNQIGSDGSVYVDMPGKENGIIGKGEYHISAQHADFAKLRFIAEKE